MTIDQLRVIELALLHAIETAERISCVDDDEAEEDLAELEEALSIVQEALAHAS